MKKSYAQKNFKKPRNTYKNQWLRKLSSTNPDQRSNYSKNHIIFKNSKLKFYIFRKGQTFGPYSQNSILIFIQEGRADIHDWAWVPGNKNWIPLGQILEENTMGKIEKSWLSKALEKIDSQDTTSSKLEIIQWACNQCGLKPLEVDARRMYVTDDSGERHLCPHPLEYTIAERYLGSQVSDQVLKERTGYYEDHFCSFCFEIFLLDSEKDPMRCKKCGKKGMKRGIELANQNCPKCKKGVFIGHPMDTRFIDEIIESIPK